MKKLAIAFFGMCFVTLLVQGMYHNQNVKIVKEEKSFLVDQEGNISEALLQLLALTGVEHDGSLESIVQKTQAEWLRKPGVERWDIIDANEENKGEFFKLFKELNLLDQINPREEQYDYALLMGATLFRVRTRLQNLIDLWNQGVRFNQIVILSGARPLESNSFESEQELLKTSNLSWNLLGDLPTTEAGMMQLVYDQAEMPAEMRQIPVVMIDVPMKITKDNKLARPTTGDTVNLWMEAQPDSGRCLVISNQPYIGYQDSVTRSLLPDRFKVETVGQESQDNKIGTYLDTLARNLYQEKKRLKL